MRGMRPRVFAAAMAAAGVIAIGAGCGGGGGGGTTSGKTANLVATPGISEQTNDKIASEVPSSVKSKGTLIVAADATYPPNEFIKPNTNTVIGMDADLAKMLAQLMGLDVQVKNVTFDAILPGLAAHKYDLGMSSFTVTKEREKEVDFVSYAIAGTSFYVNAQGGPNIQTIADLCGEKVAVERGTIQADQATAQSKKCKAAGKSGVDLSVFPDQNGANLAISSGRADVGMADSPPAAYIVEQSNGQFKLVGKPYGEAVYGIAMPKDSGLEKPVLDALKQVMSDGTYDKIFSYWGLVKQGTSGCPCTIDNPQINPKNVPPS
jgi:polar amino acid transport system substrate-binding protein